MRSGPDTYRLGPVAHEQTLTTLNLVKTLAAGILHLGLPKANAEARSPTRIARNLCSGVLDMLDGNAERAAEVASMLAAAGIWPGSTRAALRRCAATIAYCGANLAAVEEAAKRKDRRKPAADADHAVRLARALVALAPDSPRPHYLLASAWQVRCAQPPSSAQTSCL